jgi:hypothetical protein
MTGFNTLAIQDAITARIETALPNHKVIEDGIVDDANLLRDENQQLVPYIIVRYGPLRRKYLGYAVAGSRHDDHYATTDIMCIAPKGRMAREGLMILTDALIGYKPDGTSEMTIEGGTSEFVVMSNEARPTAFVSSIRFRFGVNQEGVGELLTPPTP